MGNKKSKEVIKAVNDYLQSDDNEISEGYFIKFGGLNKEGDETLFKELQQEGILTKESSGNFPFHKSDKVLEEGKTKDYQTLLKEMTKDKKKTLLNKRTKWLISLAGLLVSLMTIVYLAKEILK